MLSDCKAVSCFGSRELEDEDDDGEEDGDGDVGGSNGRASDGAEVGDGVGGSSMGGAGVAAVAVAVEIKRRSEKITAFCSGCFIVGQRDVGRVC